MENMMLDNVLDSPGLLNVKLQAMHSGGYEEYHPQASTHDYVCPNSPSVNHMHLQYDVISFPEQAKHTISHNPLLPVSSSTSPPPLTATEDVALINHLLAHADSASWPFISCKKEGREQNEDLTVGLVRSLMPTSGSFLRSHHSPYHSSSTSVVQYLPQGPGAASVSSSSLSSSRDSAIAQKHMQDDPLYGCLIASGNLSFLKDHTSCPSRPDYMSCLLANDGQELNTACSWDGGNHQMAAMSTSSSSSTPSSLSSGLTHLAKENLQVWTAFDSSVFNPALRDLNDVSEKQAAQDIHIKNGTGIVQEHNIVGQKTSSRQHVGSTAASAMAMSSTQEQKKMMKKRKRKRMSHKNVEEMETQRMTHIAVERNRRKQMNEHLRALRLLMPPSYIQRGDQASIVGGTIRFVEELEQILQSLRLQKQLQDHRTNIYEAHTQQYHEQHVEDTYANTRSNMANVEVTMLTSSTMFMKVLAQKRPHQLFHTLLALSNLSLRVTHLNITTIGLIMIYNFNLQMDGDCQLLTPFGLAESIQHIFVNFEAKA